MTLFSIKMPDRMPAYGKKNITRKRGSRNKRIKLSGRYDGAEDETRTRDLLLGKETFYH